MQARCSPPWLLPLLLLSWSRGWARPCLPTTVGGRCHSGAAGPFAAAVPIPNSGVLWVNQSNAWSTGGEAWEDLWHENTRARRDTAKPMASPAPPSWGAQREPHAPHPPCPAPHHGAALGGFLFSPPWEPRTRLTPWPACAHPVPPTAAHGSVPGEETARGCSGVLSPKSPRSPRVESRALAPIGRT